MHAYLCTDMHTYVQTCTHACLHACMHTQRYAHGFTCMHTHMCTHQFPGTGVSPDTHAQAVPTNPTYTHLVRQPISSWLHGFVLQHNLARLPSQISSFDIQNAGVPTRKRKQQQQGARKQRPFIMFHNATLSKWKARRVAKGQHAGRGRCRRQAQAKGVLWQQYLKVQQRCKRQWKKSALLRRYWQVQCLDAHRKAATAPTSLPGVPAPPFESLWNLGDEGTPVTIERLKAVAERHASSVARPQNQCPGPMSAGQRIIEEEAGKHMVSDPVSPDTPLPKIDRPLTCADLHAGICQRQAGTLLPVILTACCNLNTLCSGLTKDVLRAKVLRIQVSMVGGDVATQYWVLAECRFAQPVLQVYCTTQAESANVVALT